MTATAKRFEARWRDALHAAQSQCLADLHATDGSALVFVRTDRPVEASAFFDEAVLRAGQEGFVTARVRVLESRAFDALDLLVRAVARALVAPEHAAAIAAGERPATGLRALLDAFVERHKSRVLAQLELGLAAHGAGGDLCALARAYCDPPRRPQHEARRIEAWVSGTELSRSDEAAALSALSPRTARRALREITHLVRVLGWRGTLVVFERAEVLPRLPAGRRDDAYTVLRELVDDNDTGRGLVATRLVVSAGPLLFDSKHGIGTLAPLAMRVLPLSATPPERPPPPHAPFVTLQPPPRWDGAFDPPEAPAPTPVEARAALGALQRASHGLPPTVPVPALSVGHEHIDATISQLFEHAAMESSVFALLVGGYGTGKSHLLSHLAARALRDQRPVFRLSLERMDNDLGNPQRHLRRMLDQAVLPLQGAPSPLDRLVHWTRTPLVLRRVLEAVHALAEGDTIAAPAARKLRQQLTKSRSAATVVESFLGAAELVEKPAGANYRQDAYQRLMLWLSLLETVEGCKGPVVIVDEAENLYRGGNTRASRRTALRSLSFYCGGALPGACVVMAVTPDALDQLREESAALLEDVSEQRTVLAMEDAAMFRRRLTHLRPLPVPALTRGMLSILAFRVREVHQSVRGPVDDPRWSSFVFDLVAEESSPRRVLRALVDRLEGAWWARRNGRGATQPHEL